MAIMQRFMTVVKSNLNHWIGGAEDPEKMLTQMLLDMQEQLINSKRQVAVAIADEKRLMKQLDQERSNAADWEGKAMLAVKAGDDDLARQALARKTEHDKMVQGFSEQWQSQQAAVEQLKVGLQSLSNKIEDAKRKKNLLVARAKRAEAQKSITETMSGLSQSNAFDTIGRMEEKIERMEAEASATTELAQEITGDELSAKFEKLKVLGSDDALLALKEKMGVSKPRQLLTATVSPIESERLAEAQVKK